MAYPAGESDLGISRPAFDRRLKLEFHGARVTSDAGLLAYCELDDALGLTTLADTMLSDGRRGRNTRHLLIGLLRQSVRARPESGGRAMDHRNGRSAPEWQKNRANPATRA